MIGRKKKKNREENEVTEEIVQVEFFSFKNVLNGKPICGNLRTKFTEKQNSWWWGWRERKKKEKEEEEENQIGRFMLISCHSLILSLSLFLSPSKNFFSKFLPLVNLKKMIKTFTTYKLTPTEFTFHWWLAHFVSVGTFCISWWFHWIRFDTLVYEGKLPSLWRWEGEY